MRILWSVITLSCVVSLACAGGDAAKDTVRDSSAPADPSDQRADAMSGAAASDPGVAPTSRAPTMLIVGTSLTAGLGLDPGQAYPAVIQRKADSAGYGVQVINAGLSGETSAGALRRMDWLLRERASIVMIETGANDGLRGVDVDSTRANLEAIMALVKDRLPTATILLAQMEAPPNMGSEYTRRFHETFVRVAQDQGVELLPFLLEGVAGVRGLNQSDGIHPTAAGAVKVAENLWGSLAPHLSRLANVQ